MALHLVKLCVGVDEPSDLLAWQKKRRAQMKAQGVKPYTRHLTRNSPRRAEEILAGGSLYWVMKGVIRARQRIVGFGAIKTKDGEPRCEIRLDAKLVRVVPRPMRAFQGWRYLEAADAPEDLDRLGEGVADLPPGLAEELRELGLL